MFNAAHRRPWILILPVAWQHIPYYFENLFKKGKESLDFDDEIVKGCLVTHQAKIVHEGILKAMQ